MRALAREIGASEDVSLLVWRRPLLSQRLTLLRLPPAVTVFHLHNLFYFINLFIYYDCIIFFTFGCLAPWNVSLS
jgi:hypothetical protein